MCLFVVFQSLLTSLCFRWLSTIKHNSFNCCEVLARSDFPVLWNTKSCRMHAQEGHSWCAVKKSYISFWDRPLIFSHSPIKAWQAALALLFLTLPCPINLISEAFWFTVETGLGNRTGRSCQSIQLAHPVWSEVSASPGDHTVQITCVVFDLSRSKYLLLLRLWRAYFESEYIWA